MEDLEVNQGSGMFNDIYHNRRVLITGHTGFKGSWLALWLLKLGAKITGYALRPPTEPNHFDLLDLPVESIFGDIRDSQRLKHLFAEQQPEVVFHLAAQPIVSVSYHDPVDTFSSNVMGTINVFEAARSCKSVRAIINVTSDKCYENREWPWGYREIDPVGGYDPYSASKGCAEIVTSCWRNSFFNPKDYGTAHNTLVASARAGNVIGGGDWAVDRLIPDMMRSACQNRKMKIRHPHATRPWQHVLEPLSGYLLLGQRLLEGREEFSEAWNLGPTDDGNATVAQVASRAKQAWPRVAYETIMIPSPLHEASMLSLDFSKARSKLRWNPVWDGRTAVWKTVLWYKAFYETKVLLTQTDLDSYIRDANAKHLSYMEQ